MVTNRKTKSNKLRGSRTHGWGSPKKHRGSGSRGGVGNAGAGKKGQQKMTLLHNKGIRIGAYGFKRPPAITNESRILNLDDIEKNTQKYITKQEKDVTEIDTTKLGYDKILGRGKVTSKLKIISKEFSKKAIEKIEQADGEAIIKESIPKTVAENKPDSAK